MKKRWIYVISISVLITLWFLLYIMINHDLILPSPIAVFRRFFEILFSFNAIFVIFSTLIRLLLAIFISAAIGIIFALISYFRPLFGQFMKPYVTILRTIPVISIVVILLIILGYAWTPYAITFFMVFPIIYQAVYQGLHEINHELLDVIKLEEKHMIFMIFGFYLPQIKSHIFLSFLQSFSLGLKVLVMAEYLSQTKQSIGNEIYLAKVNLLYQDVFAWTIVLIVIAVLIELFIQHQMKVYKPKIETRNVSTLKDKTDI